ncbi:hypothetical protein OIU14_02310 [Thalassobacter stenotrophicus]|uniref:hypothetical protein n=1 Tax=Thalassobacter stenotrophicus TaxID=266809 RepID=UPI0022A9C10D|nr:hypothetical protein [Thalassobacter stenotrophicus]UYP69762.1 hypothetical protein OIU14_02310 [Thalassobacter stenotrophicus]
MVLLKFERLAMPSRSTPKGAILHHSANEVTEAGPRGARKQAILVGMGVYPGFADLMILSEGRPLFLELKSPKGRLSQAQKTFRDAVLAQKRCACVKDNRRVHATERNYGPWSFGSSGLKLFHFIGCC